jgi:hypothetical protein
MLGPRMTLFLRKDTHMIHSTVSVPSAPSWRAISPLLSTVFFHGGSYLTVTASLSPVSSSGSGVVRPELVGIAEPAGDGEVSAEDRGIGVKFQRPNA